ncbi:MFS transporter [Paenibacillus sp. P96]|uniref:MFS transporter n=1 Tax=Paenibacillus zeirhizosphaerae TaxID=2987519 RepID=A0ABT9FWC8_9BACL|nr:MFS transporter [Paenibacillus sp. P96]MDP4099010.1 MFS transporter [Paenibacillus sp. P96]
MSIKNAAKSASGRPLPIPGQEPKATVFAVLLAISLVHLFNDTIQSVIPAIFPILMDSMQLTYTQLGWISFAINFTASIMQPVVGMFSDRRPTPSLLPIGMGFTLTGMLLLALAQDYAAVLLAVVFVGLGSAAFHPEGSRVSHMAAGSRRGLAQSIFQVGGNAGQSLAPLLTSLVFVPLGQFGAIWFTVVAGAGILVQVFIARWYGQMLRTELYQRKTTKARRLKPDVKNRIIFALVVLIVLVFVRSWYNASIGSYYSFYLIQVFNLPLETAMVYIFLFLGAGALGTFFGGPLADRFGKRNMIFLSMALSAPLALLLPYANLFWTGVLLALIGFIMLSSFSVTVVYAQMLIPGRIGTISGLITGLAFGLGGVGALVLGNWIDKVGIEKVMVLCGFLPLLGVLSFLLPSDKQLNRWAEENGAEV